VPAASRRSDVLSDVYRSSQDGAKEKREGAWLFFLSPAMCKIKKKKHFWKNFKNSNLIRSLKKKTELLVFTR
jgi:hypothetical protein